jgi:hypothetical protein
MKSKFCVAAIATLSLMASVPASATIVTFVLIPLEPSQVSQTPTGLIGEVRLGLAVDSRTNFSPFLRTLTVGAGWTMQCLTSGLAHKAERSLQNTNAGQLMLTVTAPATIPARYTIFGWETVADDNCTLCLFEFKGQAVEEASHIAISNTGVSFQLTPNAATVSEANSLAFYMCKPPGCDEE